MADLLTTILTLPLAPLRAVTSLAQILLDEARQELSAAVRRQLEELDEQFQSGAISQADYDAAQRALLERLT